MGGVVCSERQEPVSLKVPKGTLTSIPHSDQPESVTTLAIGWNKICSLEGVQKMRNLTELVAPGNELDELQPMFRLRRVRKLNLACNKLKTVSSSIAYMQSLECINMSNNRIITVPYLLHSLRWLTHLDMSNNRMTGMAAMAELLPFPPTLVTLNLSGNRFLKLPDRFFLAFPLLENLSLASCGLSVLPPDVGAATRLKRLDVSSNYLRSLPKEFGRLLSRGTLTALDLSHNELEQLPADLARLQLHLKLRRLDLSGNPFVRQLPVPRPTAATPQSSLATTNEPLPGAPPARSPVLRAAAQWTSALTIPTGDGARCRARACRSARASSGAARRCSPPTTSPTSSSRNCGSAAGKPPATKPASRASGSATF